MLCMKCVAGSVRVLLLQRVLDWVVSSLGIVPCNAWSVDCRVQSRERKVNMVFSISRVFFGVSTHSCIHLTNAFRFVVSIHFFRIEIPIKS